MQTALRKARHHVAPIPRGLHGPVGQRLWAEPRGTFWCTATKLPWRRFLVLSKVFNSGGGGVEQVKNGRSRSGKGRKGVWELMVYLILPFLFCKKKRSMREFEEKIRLIYFAILRKTYVMPRKKSASVLREEGREGVGVKAGLGKQQQQQAAKQNKVVR